MNTYNKINSIFAFRTRDWGPSYWFTLFTMILGSYPVKFDPNNIEHYNIKQAFIHTLEGLKYTMPCSLCRESYKQFYRELPIDKYTDSKINMALWLYKLKNKVNKKLGKPANVSFEKVLESYIQYSAKKCSVQRKKCE